MSIWERFYSKTKLNNSSGCLEWTASTRSGYGAFKVDGKSVSTHRYVFELNDIEIAKGLIVCHKCDNPRCVNLDHLFLGTYKDNVQDCISKGRFTKHGGGGLKKPITHGTQSGYRRKCRCEKCRNTYNMARKLHYKKTGN